MSGERRAGERSFALKRQDYRLILDNEILLLHTGDTSREGCCFHQPADLRARWFAQKGDVVVRQQS
jgi:hypothetical protein